MIRVVLDTNILVSAAISAGGDCDQIVQAALRGAIRIVVSPGILDEHLDVLHRSKFTRYGFPPAWVQHLLSCAEQLPADPMELPEAPDPEDRVFLGVAQQVGLLVTGNLKHFPREIWGGANVMSPKAFLDFPD
ncbi:MAG: putative toxin-antitoxin system toxin component, PIN family [Geothrix sp.]|nr:putative toxin-antitoxin system toxin component, PIN family [Geothrix sp.]